jgi:hypothetical protein
VLIQVALTPLLVVLLVATFSNLPYLRVYFNTLPTGYAQNLAATLPVIDPGLEALLLEAKVSDNQPIAYYGNDGSQMQAWSAASGMRGLGVTSPPPLLPMPLDVLLPLPQDRLQQYLGRFIAQEHRSGWLVLSKPTIIAQWLFDQLADSYTITRTFENANWKLEWLQYHPHR